jgi:hypothetical protein
MKTAILYHDSKPHQRVNLDVLKAGFKKHNVEVTDIHQADFVCYCSVNVQRHHGERPYLMVDRCFFGSDSSYLALSWNGWKGSGIFCVEDAKHDRGRQAELRVCQPWQIENTGRLIYFGDAQLARGRVSQGLCRSLLRKVERYAKENGIELLIRGHAEKKKPLDLENCRGAITISSSVGIKTLMAGIPTTAESPMSPIYPITKEFPEFQMVDYREPFFAYLAQCNWSLDEIAQGHAWDQLKGFLVEPAKYKPLMAWGKE